MFQPSLLKKNSHLHFKWLFFFCVIGSSLFLANCSQEKESEQVIATVNDSEITVSDFEQKYVGYLIKTGRNDIKNERYRYLSELIDNLAVADAAIQKNYLGNQTYQDAIWYQKRKSLADIYFVDQMNERIENPSEEDVRLAFAKSKRKVYVRHLFSKDEDKLYRYYNRLEAGENFVDLANEFYGTAEYDSTAGYLGPISYYGIDDNFAETAFSINEGGYSEPIRTSFGYHIIYVEKVLFEAMLTESEYQIRKEGIQNKVKQRNQALEANAYIRDLMSKVNIEMNREPLVSLMEEIRNLPSIQEIDREQEDGDMEGATWNDGKLDELALEVDEQSVLGTYVLLGERIDFTIEDYLNWLPYLPLNESRNRTGASVGRALRNEVLMRLAKEEGYENDDRVNKKVKDRGMEVLSDLYQQELIQIALQDTSETEIPENFRNQVIRNRSYNIETSYWKIPATSLEEAKVIRRDILSGTPPQTFPNYTSIEQASLSPIDADYRLVSKATVGSPVTASSETQGWVVLNVNDKEFIQISVDDPGKEVEKMYRVLNFLDTKIDSMRSASDVVIDTTLFDEIYEL
ncbi:MAG: hypothetical protein CL670_11385 [Balneola sp.]|nr:hypothetical protein [Balneola sp.]MBE79749.1 hypothetical protein [Balneola sp.]|tara:strand:- start:44950 stop:46671 length:1722 start_codon:yes stop_codon:yes gene_type:complete